ncbi:hypothetical protein AVBRAN12642_08085 [Campylobacter sp. RM12642]|uniref:hypothetical protein n=1 Tax=unclassified Campylobacter TaxID=2593542 RepID=UPI001DEF6538|nr:hypothetical protein [Campylobacter sp. RM12642]MBZ8008098.1 hypothetical protein [Campylobacter sp. RM9334]
MNKTTNLPIFGVGPIYVITCLLLAIFGLCLDYFGFLDFVKLPKARIFMSILGGVLLFAYNLCLLVLPFIFCAFLTVLMKKTEEKWLQEKFGDSYTQYYKKANRIIPWFKR